MGLGNKKIAKNSSEFKGDKQGSGREIHFKCYGYSKEEEVITVGGIKKGSTVEVISERVFER